MKKVIRLFLILFACLISLSVIAKESTFFVPDFSSVDIAQCSDNSFQYDALQNIETFFLQVPHNDNSYIQQLKQKENTPFGNLNSHFVSQVVSSDFNSDDIYTACYLSNKSDFIQKSFLSEIQPNAP